jgi:hypothetical protein
MIRSVFSGIAVFALMTGAALAQEGFSSTTTSVSRFADAPVLTPASDEYPGYYRDNDGYYYRDGYYRDSDDYYYRGGYYYRNGHYYRDDAGAHALAGGAAGAGAGAVIGCIVTIPIGCAPGAAVGAAVGGGAGAVAGAASTPPPRHYYVAPPD